MTLAPRRGGLPARRLSRSQLRATTAVRACSPSTTRRANFLPRSAAASSLNTIRWLRKVVYTDWYAPPEKRRRVLYLDKGEQDGVSLLSHNDLARLWELLTYSTRENPYVQMQVLIPVNGNYRWHILNARTIWTTSDLNYSGAVGQFTDIHDAMGTHAPEAATHGDVTLGETVARAHHLRELFTVVRLVDPDTNHVLNLQPDGTLRASDECCHALWGREHACENCTSLRALKNGHWSSKLELKDATLFFVLSRYLRVGGARVRAGACPRSLTRCSAAVWQARTDITCLIFTATPLRRRIRACIWKNSCRIWSTPTASPSRMWITSSTSTTPTDTSVGDEALRAISGVILERTRETDTLIRYGGDELLLIFPQIGEDAFRQRLTQLREAVQQIVLADAPELRLDISIGGAYRVSPLAEAIRQADRKMYEQKAAHAAERGQEL